jgi:hypothetical protein
MSSHFDVYAEDFSKTVEFLGQFEQFFSYLEAVAETREYMVRQMSDCPDERLGRLAGAVSALTEMLDLAGYEELKEKFSTLPQPIPKKDQDSTE